MNQKEDAIIRSSLGFSKNNGIYQCIFNKKTKPLRNRYKYIEYYENFIFEINEPYDISSSLKLTRAQKI